MTSIWKGGHLEAVKRHKSKNPWFSSYRHAKERCAPSGKYGKRGIKFLMTKEDFKYLWERDNAYLMKRPSIDRIDTTGDYIASNCRFIELSENRSRIKARTIILIKNWDPNKTIKENSWGCGFSEASRRALAKIYNLKYRKIEGNWKEANMIKDRLSRGKINEH